MKRMQQRLPQAIQLPSVHHIKTDLSQIVAIDIIGAGIGEYVLVAQGSAARIGCGEETAPIDAAIVGIIDDGAGLE